MNYDGSCNLWMHFIPPIVTQAKLQHWQITLLQQHRLTFVPAERHQPLWIFARGVQSHAPDLPALWPHSWRGSGQGLLRTGHQGIGFWQKVYIATTPLPFKCMDLYWLVKISGYFHITFSSVYWLFILTCLCSQSTNDLMFFRIITEMAQCNWQILLWLCSEV